MGQEQSRKVEMMDAEMVVEFDVGARNPNEHGSSERVITAAWDSAMSIVIEYGVGMARTVPWDAGRRRRDRSSDDATDDDMLHRIFSSKVIGDSCYFTTSSDADKKMSSDGESSPKRKKAKEDTVEGSSNTKGEKQCQPLLSGRPIHPTYVDSR